MRTTKIRSRLSLLFIALAALIAFPAAAALADDIRDVLDTTALETQTINPGDTNSTGFTNEYFINANASGASPAGCDVGTEGDNVTATFKFSNPLPSGVTANKSSITFDECRDGSDLNSQTIKFTSETPGTYQIPALIKDSGTGTFTNTNSDFTLVVNKKDASITNVSGEGTEGETADLTAKLVSGYKASEDMSGKTISFKLGSTSVGSAQTGADGVATLTDVPLPTTYTASGSPYTGAVKASFATDSTYKAVTDTAGDLTVNSADSTPPVISYILTPDAPDGSNGWYKSNVTLVWDIDEDESPDSLSKTGCVDQNITANQQATTYKCSATSDGGSAPEQSVTIKRDATAPVVSRDTLADSCDTPGNSDWCRGTQTAGFAASDATSGLASGQGAKFVKTSTTQGSTVSIPSGSVSDAAGNSNSGINAGPFKIDSIAPSITDVGTGLGPTTNPNTNGWYKSPVSVKFSASDGTSGLPTGFTNPFTNSSATDTDGLDIRVNSGSVSDVAGNTNAGANSTNSFDIDLGAPSSPLASFTDASNNTISPNSNGWYKDLVKVSYSGSNDPDLDDSNPGSGVASYTAPQTFSTSSNSHSYSGKATDKADNESDPTTGTVKVDATKPTVNISCPTGTLIVGDAKSANWAANDAHSGLQSAASGSVTLDTSSPGQKTATAPTATDKVGHTSDAATCTYTVSYTFDGFLQPIDGHSVNTGKFGRTYPIKWQLRDSSGALISDSAAQALVGTMTGGQKSVSCTSFDLSDTDALEEATTGNTALRYDATSDQFIYNYKAPTSGSCYVFAIRNADGLTTQQVDFKFTK